MHECSRLLYSPALQAIMHQPVHFLKVFKQVLTTSIGHREERSSDDMRKHQATLVVSDKAAP
jgi:hypothetical protein